MRKLLNAPLTQSGHERLAWTVLASGLKDSELWNLSWGLVVKINAEAQKKTPDVNKFDEKCRRHRVVCDLIRGRIIQ